jgi:hypothetical protein
MQVLNLGCRTVLFDRVFVVCFVTLSLCLFLSFFRVSFDIVATYILRKVPITLNRLETIAKRHKLVNQGLVNVGASWYT